jgi:hypothetical protein
MQYTVIEANTALKLAELINILISDGWIPLGGVSVSMSHDATGSSYKVFAQAMTYKERV